jgi:hypothetical protein
MSHKVRCIVLIIRVTASLTPVLIWIICSRQQSTAGGFKLQKAWSFLLLYRSCDRDNH